MGKKIIVAHPQMQHSMRTAEALKKSNMLLYYETMNYNTGGMLKCLEFIPSVRRFMKRCKESGLADEEIRKHLQLGGFVLELVARLDKRGFVSYKIYRFLDYCFGHKVADDVIKYSADAVIMYDYTAVSCFEKLMKKKPDTIKILDMSSIPTRIIDRIIAEEEQKGNGKLFQLKRRRYSHDLCNYYHKEIKLADYFISPSQSVTEALLELNVEKERIKQVTFGVDLESFNISGKRFECNNSKINFLYVGRMEAAKGIHYLIEAFKNIEARSSEFCLTLVGDSCGNEKLFKKLAFVEYKGVISKEEIKEVYKNADVFVFPSLWEGCSLSLMEAMSSGLPVLATERSGAKEFVEEGVEGFVVPGGDSDCLTEKIEWFLNNRASISSMGERAAHKMSIYSWNNYYKDFQRAVDLIL